MSPPASPNKRVCDILVAGAGLAGLTAAIALAREGFDVVACGGDERLSAGRTVAMLGPTLAYLDRLGLWEAVQPLATPMRGLRIIDDTGSLFPPRPVEFRSSEIGLDAFGWNVENDRMADTLAAAAMKTSGVERIAERIDAYDFSGGKASALLPDGRRIEAALIVGADGRESPARKAAGLIVRRRPYPQSALTALLTHRLPHEDFSTEFHTRGGPFTLVPLPSAPGAANRSSLVWLMREAEARRRAALSNADLTVEIERQGHSLLGAMQLEGPRGIIPMVRNVVPNITSERLALVGDAAHAFPPIGAQGLNLGLRDVEALAAATAEARVAGRDIGGVETLEAYQRARRADIATRTAAVDGLNRSLLANFAPVDFARGAGLAALGAIGPLRRLVMREGVSARFHTQR